MGATIWSQLHDFNMTTCRTEVIGFCPIFFCPIRHSTQLHILAIRRLEQADMVIIVGIIPRKHAGYIAILITQGLPYCLRESFAIESLFLS